ncbi:MAG: aconitase X swivel domain-containing protein [Burkholderiales bacterium]
MTARPRPLPMIRVKRAFGPVVEGVAAVSTEGFSPRYDLDRWSGIISRPGHALEGVNIRDRILFTPSAKGGIAAGWAFYDLKGKGIAPKAFIFGVTNPVMVQGAVFAGITITEGWTPDPLTLIRTGDLVRVDPQRKTIEVLDRPSGER